MQSLRPKQMGRSLLSVDRIHSAGIGLVKTWIGTAIKGIDGGSYNLRTVQIVNDNYAVSELEDGLIAKFCWLPERSDRHEWDRRLRQSLAAKDLTHTRIVSPTETLTLQESFRGYVLHNKKDHRPLSELILKESDEDNWYQKASLRTRLILAARLAQIVEEWKNLAIAKWDWDPREIMFSFARSQHSIWFTDRENFVIPTRSVPFSRQRYDSLAPELILGHRQPDIQTDTFSLAVMIYLLLFGEHPYGSPGAQADGNAKFVGISESQSKTAPRLGVATKRLSSLFSRCFIKGRASRLTRPTAFEWYEACLLAADKTLECHHCRRSFYSNCLVSKGETFFCPLCDGKFPVPIALSFFSALLVEEPQPHYKRNEFRDNSLLVDASPRKILGRHVYVFPSEAERKKHFACVSLAPGGVQIENLHDQPLLIYSPSSVRPRHLKPKEARKVAIGSRVYFERPNTERTVRGFQILHATGTYV